MATSQSRAFTIGERQRFLRERRPYLAYKPEEPEASRCGRQEDCCVLRSGPEAGSRPPTSGSTPAVLTNLATELAESLNSMLRLYERASVCFVHLFDIVASPCAWRTGEMTKMTAMIQAMQIDRWSFAVASGLPEAGHCKSFWHPRTWSFSARTAAG